MVRNYLLAGALLVAFAAPASAATMYYVAKDAKTHKCAVIAKKPDGKSWTMVGKADYKTKTDASKALGAAADCK
jgi:hypothetical protein